MAGDEVSPRKWSDREQTKAGWDASLETWELTLRHPKRTPFEITAVRQIAAAEATSASAGGGPMVLTLASLPEATSQTGSLVVRQRGSASHSHGQPATETDSPRVASRGPRPGRGGRLSLRSGPPGCPRGDRRSPRFDPEKPDPWQAFPWRNSRTAASKPPPGAWQAWVWDCHLQSWYQVDGTIRHQATLDLHNAVRRGLTFALRLSPERTCEAFPSTAIPSPGAGRPATVPACWESICP